MATAQDPSGGIVHEVRWADALPWWILFRAAGAAFSPTVILLAALGALATWAGWSAADQLGLAGIDPAADAIAAAKAGDIALTLPAGGLPGRDPLLPSGQAVPWLGGLVDRLPPVAADVVRLVAVPFRPSATITEPRKAGASSPSSTVSRRPAAAAFSATCGASACSSSSGRKTLATIMRSLGVTRLSPSATARWSGSDALDS